MNIALIGAGGNIGQRIATEALSRGHQVTGIQRDPSKITNDKVVAKQGDLSDVDGIAGLLKGHDVVVSAIAPADRDSFLQYNRNLVEAVRKAGVPRLLLVGGAGSLLVAPGVDVLDSGALDAFPWKWIAEAAREVNREVAQVTDVNWTYFSPAGVIDAGERTGKFRTAGNELVVGADGKSFISYEDYAVALIDELENPQYEGRQMTVGY